MGSLSLPRPLLAALAIVIAFAGAWMMVLRPHPATQTQAAIPPPVAAAPVTAPATAPAPVKHTTAPVRSRPVATSHTSARPGTTRTAHAARPGHHSLHPARPDLDATVPVLDSGHAVAAVDAALKAGKVIALLLFNPAGPDDQADRGALAHVSSRGGLLVRLAAPIRLVPRLSAVTTNVQVTTSPTLVIIDRHHAATTVTGFVDPLEYEQAVAAAFAAGK